MECYERRVACEHKDATNHKRFQINFYLAHKAAVRKSPTREGFTHDWTVMLRSDDAVKIHDIIEKVVFKLHPTFSNPKRGFKFPPYQVVESGYGGFTFPIDVHLKNDGEPKLIRFMYTLYLGVTPSVSHCRCEKIIFENPSQSFSERLHRSGATPLQPLNEMYAQKMNLKRSLRDDNDSEINHDLKKATQELKFGIFNRVSQSSHCTSDRSAPTRKRGRPRKNAKPSNQNKENVSPQHATLPSSYLPSTPRNETSRNDNFQGNLSLSMNSFFRSIQNDPSLASTPVTSKSILKNASAINRKSNLKLRFKSYVEEYSMGDDEKVILSEGMQEYRKKLADKYARLTPLKDCSNDEDSLPNNDPKPKCYDLVLLQNTLMTITDKKVLKKVVRIIDESGHLRMTKNSIDFDLCALDEVTLEKVRHCLLV